MKNDPTRSPLELLYNVSRELASALELRTVLQRVLFQSLKYVGGERGSIVVLDDAGKVIDAAIVYGRKIIDHTTQQLRETTERGLAGWVMRNRQPAWVPDTSRDERWLRRPDDALDRSGAKAAMCVPLLAREQMVGVMTLVHPKPGSFTEDQFNLVQSIADQAGISIINARLYTESQHRARVMTALAASAETINASLEMDQVLQRILGETIQALQVETVALALLEADGDLVFNAATGKNAKGFGKNRVPSGQGVIGWVAHEGQGVVIPVVREDKRFRPDVEQFTGLEAHALACAPIYAQGRVIGILEAINPVSGAFNPDALLVLTGIGNLAGSTIQHAQLFERLQAAHKRYRELFDDSIDPIYITDWDGKILESNRQAAVLGGFKSGQLHGMKIDDLFAANRDERNLYMGRVKKGQTCELESVLRTKSGREIPVQVYVRRISFEDSELLQWILRDISERKDLDSLREDLTAMIYHDLRSPLANIVSSLDVLATIFPDVENESVRSVLNIAQRSTARIQRLISSLLDINRLESGQPVGTQQEVSLKLLLDDALDAVNPMLESRNQTIATVIPTPPPSLWVDMDMIRRVLINLLENASKFSPPEGRIEIGAEREENWVQIWVQDNGPGIPQKEQERIFDKFIRVDAEHSPGGLGVGLAFCRLAIQGHGGRIWVESKPGHGARFLLTLPISHEL